MHKTTSLQLRKEVIATIITMSNIYLPNRFIFLEKL